MRKLVLFIACSLDGYIARSGGEIDWLFHDQDYGYSEFYASIDTVLLGRRTYEQSLTFGDYPYPGTRTYVFSKELAGQRDAHASFVGGDIARFIADLKREPGKTIWLVGGSEIIHTCVVHDLIDEYLIYVHPIVLGGGIPLFRSPLPTTALTLTGTHAYDSGLVKLAYAHGRAQSP